MFIVVVSTCACWLLAAGGALGCLYQVGTNLHDLPGAEVVLLDCSLLVFGAMVFKGESIMPEPLQMPVPPLPLQAKSRSRCVRLHPHLHSILITCAALLSAAMLF